MSVGRSVGRPGFCPSPPRPVRRSVARSSSVRFRRCPAVRRGSVSLARSVPFRGRSRVRFLASRSLALSPWWGGVGPVPLAGLNLQALPCQVWLETPASVITFLYVFRATPGAFIFDELGVLFVGQVYHMRRCKPLPLGAAYGILRFLQFCPPSSTSSPARAGRDLWSEQLYVSNSRFQRVQQFDFERGLMKPPGCSSSISNAALKSNSCGEQQFDFERVLLDPFEFLPSGFKRPLGFLRELYVSTLRVQQFDFER